MNGLTEAPPARRRPIRIAMVVYSYYEIDRRVMRAARALAARGYLLDVFCLARDDADPLPPEEGVRFFRLPLRRKRAGSASYLMRYGAFFLWATAVLSARHFRRRYDLVYVHNLPNFLVFTAALPKVTGTKVLLDVHDPAPELLTAMREDGPSPWLLRMTRAEERVSLSFAESVITVNEAMRRRLLGIRPSARVEVVMNVPDGEVTLRPPAVARPQGPPRLVYSGTIAYRHGVDLVVEAVARLTPEFPTLRLAIVGEGPDTESVLARGRELGISDRVEFFGHMPSVEVPRFLAGAAAGVSPLREDEFGALVFSMKVPEYAAAGLPAICARTSTMRDYFSEDELFFFTPGDVDDLARVIRQVLNDPVAAAARSTRSLARVRALDWSVQRDALIGTVESLVGAP